jgi:hypothetical protein
VDSSVLPYIPRVGIIEFTTPLLNALWFLQAARIPSLSLPYRSVAALFVVSFFLLRVLYFPFLIFHSVPHDPSAFASLGWRMQPLRILTALQMYWFVKIVRKFVN